MKLKWCLLLVALCLAFSGMAGAKKAVKKKKNPYMALIEAYEQHTLPGIPGRIPTSGEHFIIIWTAKRFPETFFWRGENGGWQPCKMMKARKVMVRTADIPAGKDYITSHVKGDEILPGDTLELSPVVGGKFEVPKEIPKNAKNTLFFKTGHSGWLSYEVDSISKKNDIVNP